MDRQPAQESLHKDFLGIIGITPGEPAGIGPEVSRKAVDSGRLDPDFSYRILGDIQGSPSGQPSPATARMALQALEDSVKLALSREIAAIVTGPIHKHRMKEIGFPFPGQTEFFASRSATANFAMLLTGGALTVALVTVHVPLRQVPGLLSESEIVRVGALLEDFLSLRKQSKVKIAVAGLNPHAGESGSLGHEEIEIIAPAVMKLNEMQGGSVFSGPFSPDTVFCRAANGEFDGVLCMYHDQGLIPLKLHAFDQGVNVTLGLPFVRTSPDHGTAFEIAGKGIARPDSMISAINLAAEMVKKGMAMGCKPIISPSI